MASNIWVADDDESILWVVEKALSKQGYSVRTFSDGIHLFEAMGNSAPELVITDIHMPELPGFKLLEKINEIHPNIPVIIMTAFGDLDSAVDAYKYGAYEYITKPFDIDELLEIVSRGLETADSKQSEIQTVTQPDNDFLGESPAIQEVFRVIGRIARSSRGVLIRGESGTGKELVANAIHQNSLRNHKPLVAINTAAIPKDLLESELFGHEKGAFTGAHSRHIGRFEQADKGSLFLDEIGDMPLALQTRLLRVLSEGRFYRLGGKDEISVDVRVIAATNQQLEVLVSNGEFRNDLFHRLNVLSVIVPPLCERIQDIPVLVDHFIRQSGDDNPGKPKHLGPGVLAALQNYAWPGNIRELQNVILQTVILSIGNTIEIEDLPKHITEVSRIHSDNNWIDGLSAVASRKLRMGEKELAKSLIGDAEQTLIGVALAHTNGHRQKAAKLLGWGRNTLARKMKS